MKSSIRVAARLSRTLSIRVVKRGFSWHLRCMKVFRYARLVAVVFLLVLTSCAARANPALGAHVNLQAVHLKEGEQQREHSGPFQVPEILRERVDFWKSVFSKYGRAHSIVHHRDFPQIVFGVIDLSREIDVMSPTAFSAYKESVVQRTIEDVRAQLIELADGNAPRTPFQERMVEEFARRNVTPSVGRTWVEQDLIRSQTGIRERYAEAIRRAWRYLPVMEQIFVSEYGLPVELTRIPFIESSFDYAAYSSVGAAGIWQFMPKTARAHRMLVGRHVDERRDPLKATRAAAEYLRGAFNSLGAWPLAITSYNHGIGGVRAKVRQAGTEDLAQIIESPSERYFGFASTNFYPEFLAAVEIFEDPRAYFPEVQEEPPLQVASYSVRKSVPAPYVAKQLGMTIEDLREANYALLDSVWSGRVSIPAGYTLRVPIYYRQRADRFFGAGVTEPVAQNIVERRGGVSDQSRAQVARNDLGNMPVLRAEPIEVSQVASEPRPTTTRRIGIGVTPTSGALKRKQAATKTVTVRSGDTLSTIAKKYGTRVERIKQLNNMRGSKVSAGQKLLVPG